MPTWRVEDDAEVLPRLGIGGVAHVGPEDGGGARVGVDGPEEEADGGGLPGPVLADEAEDAPEGREKVRSRRAKSP